MTWVSAVSPVSQNPSVMWKTVDFRCSPLSNSGNTRRAGFKPSELLRTISLLLSEKSSDNRRTRTMEILCGWSICESTTTGTLSKN